MSDTYSAVPESTWLLTETVSKEIRDGILKEANPLSLINNLVEEIHRAATTQSKERCVAFYEESSTEKAYKNYKRHGIFMAIEDKKLFNQFFNGRAGYRAMYYHSAETGSKYNAAAVKAIIKKLGINTNPSFSAQSAKIWPFYELHYAGGFLAVDRWKEELGKNIFCCKCPAIVLKGVFISPDGEEKDFKDHRSKQIHEEGFS
jgi:hypothetical protein